MADMPDISEELIAEIEWLYNPNRGSILKHLLKVLEEKRD